MPVAEQGTNVTVGAVDKKTADEHAICLNRWPKSVHELYNSQHKYCTVALQMKVTFARQTTIS